MAMHECINENGSSCAALPWLIDLISMVLGIFSSAVPRKDLRLTLDLKSVFISVDFPKPLWPVHMYNNHINIRLEYTTVILPRSRWVNISCWKVRANLQIFVSQNWPISQKSQCMMGTDSDRFWTSDFVGGKQTCLIFFSQFDDKLFSFVNLSHSKEVRFCSSLMCYEQLESLVVCDSWSFSVWCPHFCYSRKVHDGQCFKICSDFKSHVVYYSNPKMDAWEHRLWETDKIFTNFKKWH